MRAGSRWPSALRLMGSLALAVVCASPALSQDDWVGLTAGLVSGTFSGPATTDFTDRRGYSVGIFADVETPLRPLDVQVGARLIRRGGDLVGGGGAEGDYLALPLAFAVRLHLGRLALKPLVGLEFGYTLDVRRSPGLELGFANESHAEGMGFVGFGIDVLLPGPLLLGFEGRWSAGIGAAFDGSAGDLAARTSEFIIQLGRPVG